MGGAHRDFSSFAMVVNGENYNTEAKCSHSVDKRVDGTQQIVRSIHTHSFSRSITILHIDHAYPRTLFSHSITNLHILHAPANDAQKHALATPSALLRVESLSLIHI
eukprot:3877799-Rhodomonas_salina.4